MYRTHSHHGLYGERSVTSINEHRTRRRRTNILKHYNWFNYYHIVWIKPIVIYCSKTLNKILSDNTLTRGLHIYLPWVFKKAGFWWRQYCTFTSVFTSVVVTINSLSFSLSVYIWDGRTVSRLLFIVLHLSSDDSYLYYLSSKHTCN